MSDPFSQCNLYSVWLYCVYLSFMFFVCICLLSVYKFSSSVRKGINEILYLLLIKYKNCHANILYKCNKRAKAFEKLSESIMIHKTGQ